MNKYSGCYTALITPFSKGKVDLKALEKLVSFQIKGGVSGIVSCGTTGEAATMSYEERKSVISTTVQVAAKKISVIAGIGTNCTKTTIDNLEMAREAGADCFLVVAPYYNKPTPEGLYQHFKEVAQAAQGLPVILYNVPGRTVTNLLPETVARLAQIENIVGIKEASGNLAQITETAALCLKEKPDFAILSGDDPVTVPILSIGGCGVISVASNIIPAQISKMVSDYLQGNTQAAAKIQRDLIPLIKALFIETSPAPVKFALSEMVKTGKIDLDGVQVSDEVRLPLVSIKDSSKLILGKFL